MSKIVLECNSKLFHTKAAPGSFSNLLEMIEELVTDLPNIYGLFVVDDDGDEITIGSQ